MDRFPHKALHLLSLVIFAGAAAALAPGNTRAAPSGADTGVISGVVSNSTNDRPVENAILVLQCTCLQAPLERMTNADGIYSFEELPVGHYTILLMTGKDNLSRSTRLQQGTRFRADFAFDPERS